MASSTCGLANIDVPVWPSCSVASSTCGFADIDVPICDPDCYSRRPFLSRLRLDFADVSSSCFSPGSGSVAVTSSVATPPVQSSCPVASVSVSQVQPGPVSSVAAWPTASYVQSGPVSSVAAWSTAPYVQSGPVSSVAAWPTVPPRPVASRVWHSPFKPLTRPPRLSPSFHSPVLLPGVRSLFLPMACYVLVLRPVLLPTPFGFVFSFLPVLR